MLQEIRYSIRQLLHSKSFSITAILTLAIGLGANATIFALFYSTLVRPLPFPHPNQLMLISRLYPGAEYEDALSATKFLTIKRESKTFSSVTACDIGPGNVSLMESGGPVALAELHAGAGYFSTFGIPPALGRDFSTDDTRPHAAPTAILSSAAWKNHFASNPAILGQTVKLGSENFTIIGVADAHFAIEDKIDVWLPIQAQEDASDRANLYKVIARVKPGVSLSATNADVQRVYGVYKRTYPDLGDTDERFAARDLHTAIVGDIKPALFILMGAVLMLLLIVCANILCLLLARSIARKTELAIRSALGATPLRMLRMLLTENLLLCLVGGIAAVFVAFAALPMLLHISPIELPQFSQSTLNTPIILFVAISGFVCAALFSILPALHSRSGNLDEALRGGASRSVSTRNRPQQILVIGEVAISLLLLVGAGLLFSSFWRLIHVPPGFDTKNVLTFDMTFGKDDGSNTQRLWSQEERLLNDIESLPGVLAAGTATSLPTQPHPDLPFEIVGRPRDAKGSGGEADINSISPHYLQALSVPVIRGRGFDARDTHSSTAVVLISDALAKKYFPTQNPIGEHILIGRIMGPVFADSPREIIGVVADTKEEALDREPPVLLYEPVTQVPDPITQLANEKLGISWAIRTAAPDPSLAENIRKIFQRDVQLPPLHVRPMDAVVAKSVAAQRFSAVLLGLFGGIALLLGAAGLYAVMSHSVLRQTREIGVRMAIGAGRAEVLQMVLRQAGWLLIIGVGAGLTLSLVLTRLMRSMLYGVAPYDPLTIISVSAILIFTGFAAAYLPARRASRVDPMQALRAE
jgi:predicted permease